MSRNNKNKKFLAVSMLGALMGGTASTNQITHAESTRKTEICPYMKSENTGVLKPNTQKPVKKSSKNNNSKIPKDINKRSSGKQSGKLQEDANDAMKKTLIGGVVVLGALLVGGGVLYKCLKGKGEDSCSGEYLDDNQMTILYDKMAEEIIEDAPGAKDLHYYIKFYVVFRYFCIHFCPPESDTESGGHQLYGHYQCIYPENPEEEKPLENKPTPITKLNQQHPPKYTAQQSLRALAKILTEPSTTPGISKNEQVPTVDKPHIVVGTANWDSLQGPKVQFYEKHDEEKKNTGETPSNPTVEQRITERGRVLGEYGVQYQYYPADWHYLWHIEAPYPHGPASFADNRLSSLPSTSYMGYFEQFEEYRDLKSKELCIPCEKRLTKYYKK